MTTTTADTPWNGEKITQPGCYLGMPNDTYHGDCCDGPSLSSSGAVTLMNECPARFWWDSPLNPDQEKEDKAAFDLGKAAHTALLEPATWESRISVIDADSYRTNAAKEAREAARAAGKVPLLPAQRDDIAGMREALLAHPIARKAWDGGVAEASYFYRDRGTGVWLKARPDFRPDHRRWIVDYKTTGSAHPRQFARRVYDLGYFQSAAWYMDAVAAVDGAMPEEWWFVVQETKPPYLVSVFLLDQRAVEWGRRLNRRAIDLFSECCATGKWPGYSESAQVIDLPSWGHFQLEERSEAGEFQTRSRRQDDADLKNIVQEAYAP
jgi:hypothetical protein